MKSEFNFFILFFVFFASIVSQNSLAGNKVGNGGDVVICTKQKNESLQLLDFFEQKPEIKIDKDKKEALPIAIAQIDQLKAIAPKLHRQYQRRIQELMKDIEFKENIALTDINDSFHLALPKGCSLKQIAIKKNLKTENEKLILVDKELWEKLSSVDQAGLLTHEMIYEHFSKLGETDSRKARKINSALYAKSLKTNEFWKMIQDLELPIYP